jgi:hypothetical protein
MQEIPLDTLPEKLQNLLVQVLHWGIKNAHELPVMFTPISEDSFAPTYPQALHAIEIMEKTLSENKICFGLAPNIADLLNFSAWTIENWIAGSDAPSQELIYEEAAFKTGIMVTPLTVITLRQLARTICAYSELYRTCPVSDSVDDKNFPKFMAAFNKALTSSSSAKTFDYGQNNIGIVIADTLYDFSPAHSFITGLYVSANRVMNG